MESEATSRATGVVVTDERLIDVGDRTPAVANGADQVGVAQPVSTATETTVVEPRGSHPTTGPVWTAPTRAYLLAVAAVGAALGVRLLVDPTFGERAPMWTFHIAVIVAAWLGGFGPGMLATGLGGAAAKFFFIRPRDSFQITDPLDAITITIFFLIGVVVSLLSESMHRARARAERAADESLDKDSAVRTMLDRTTDAVAVLDRHWRFVHANERACAMMGRPLGQLFGATLWQVFPHVEGSELQERLLSASQTQTPDRFESYFASMDLWAEAKVFPSAQGVTLFLTDTTAAHAAARQRAVLAAINEAARAAGPTPDVAHYIVTAVGRLLGVNRCLVTDVADDGDTVVIGRDYCDGVHSVTGIHRMSSFGREMPHHLSSGQTLTITDVNADPSLTDAERDAYDKVTVGACVVVPILNDGRLVGTFAVQSVAPRSWPPDEVALLEQAASRAWAAIESARASVTLKQSEERLRLALDAGQMGVWDWDLVTNQVAWSDRICEFHGLTKDQFSGFMEPDLPLTHPDDREHVRDVMRRAIAGEIPYQVESRAIRPDGEVRWLFSNGTVFRDASGRAIRVLGATIDITDRKRVDEQRDQLLAGERSARADAERAGRMKDEFLATLSHELRTPLNAILGWSQLIRSGRLPEDELQHGLETVERNARVQTQLIDDLLDMSRIISGKVRLEVQRLNLADVVTAAVATVRPAADAKEILLHSSVEDNACFVTGDPGRLQQVVWNLLSNAIKFTPRGGRVRVDMRRRPDPRDDAVEIVVTDSGIGITKEFLPHVFDRFRQADASTTRRHGGLGLGLSIVKQLAEMHGGSIAVRSDGPGTGAAFTVALPMTSAPELQSPADLRPRAINFMLNDDATEPTLAGLNVLVVDDEPDARELVSRLLADRGARVRAVASARDAVATIDDDPVDVIVSDIGLPGEDGYALIRKVRSRDPGHGGKVPAIALTAYARPEDRTRAILAGYQVHLTKPVEPSELLANVASLAGRTGVASDA
jgi:PAS domain S-box-containing protein